MFKLTVLIVVLLAISGLASSRYISTYNVDRTKSGEIDQVDFKVDPEVAIIKTEEGVTEEASTLEPEVTEEPEVIEEETTTLESEIADETVASLTTEAPVLTDNVQPETETVETSPAEPTGEFVPFKPE